MAPTEKRPIGPDYTNNKYVTDEDRAHLAAMNASIQSLITSGTFASVDPYLQEIDQEPQFAYQHRNPYSAQQWLQHTPFLPGENEHLQYQTYLYRSPSDDMWRQYKASFEEPAPKPVNTAGAAPKKKISLSSYMKQKAGGGSEAAKEKDAVKDMHKESVDRVKAESADTLAAVEQAESGHGDSKSSTAIAEQPDKARVHADANISSTQDVNPQKRKRDDTEEPHVNGLSSEHIKHPSKKMRGESPSEKAADNGKTSEQEKSAVETHDKAEPQMKSDAETHDKAVSQENLDAENHDNAEVQEQSLDEGMPDKISPLKETSYELPGRLSPGVPRSIETAIQAKKQGPAAQIKRTPSVNGHHMHRSPLPKDGFRTNSQSRTNTSSDADDRHRVRAHKKVDSTLSMSSTEAKSEGVRRSGASSKVNGTRSSDDSASAHRLDKPSKSSTSTAGEAVKGIARKTTPSATKRFATEIEPDAASKRLKTSNGDARPVTPTQSNLSPDFARKGLSTTPGLRKEAHATSMSRVASSDGKAHTPTIEADTPHANGHDITSTPSKTASSKSDAQRAWETERNKYDTLARKLKHAAAEHNKKEPAEHDLAAVKWLEAFICWLLACTCSDEAAAAAEPRQARAYRNWLAIRPMLSAVRGHCAKSPALAGFASLLGTVYASQVLDMMSSRPDATKEQMSEYVALLKRSSTEMSVSLDLDTLQIRFPATWEAAAKTLMHDQKLTVQDIMSGPFQLPVGMHSTPAQAARAARSLLAEWLEASDLEYKLEV